ncbi:MAG: signal recognition particle-docking protein FtsY [Bacteroidales bacterium]|nr:signal recognition particle-docking protein FtsY [Rikenellaceae bacterium]MDD6976110.1 signal recognition particle-docking protein FtsY [Bacteroidales bacterium]MDY6170850.1 signal recognition particle-docking protein FtsY [Candidatus Cryptobacteroides sp.]
MGIFDKGTNKTNRGFFERLSRAIVGKTRIDDGILDAMEEALVETDMGVDTTLKLIDALEERVSRDRYVKLEELTAMLQDEISKLLDVDGARNDGRIIDQSRKPYVILVVGVNGVGKTTTIGKLASKLVSEGKKVVLGAADTFRAAAVEQLTIWAERSGADIVKQEMGSDPASVAYDTVKSAVAKGADAVIIDTAGRLHNRIDLMNELTKIRNVIAKVIPDAPHEVLLVLDASTGQNAVQQATEFLRATKVNSIALTKLDGSAKGGVVVSIVDKFQIPLKYIGIGEGVDDLKFFDGQEFSKSLFDISQISGK